MRRWFLSLGVAIAFTTAMQAQFDRAVTLLERPDTSAILPLSKVEDTLSVSRYLWLVQQYHPDIRIAAAGVMRARGAELGAWGALDPRLTGLFATKNYEGGFKNNELTTTLSIPIYWGQRLSFGFRRATAFFDRDYLTTPEGEPSIGLTIPLLRNVLTDPIRTAITRAEQGVIAADAVFQERRNILSYNALSDYYAWTAARARYELAGRLYKLAFTRYEWIAAEIQRGERAPIDSVEILQEVFRRRMLLVRARNQIERAALTVALNIWSSDFTTITQIARYVPDNFPPMEYLDAIRIEFDRARARQRRPELRRLRAEYEQVMYDLRLAREGFKPALNANLGLYSPAWNSSLSQMPTYWKAHLSFELPILYRAPRGQEHTILAQQEQVQALLALQERRIDNEVLMAAATVNATYEQAILARAERIAAEIMVQAEQQLFERGESDLLRLNLRERLFAEAQEREIDALHAHAIAQALYRLAVADY